MRLLWLSHFVPWPATGLGALQRSHNLLRAVAIRHEVRLVALHRERLLPTGPATAQARTELGQLLRGVALVPHRGDASRLRRGWAAARALLQGSSYTEAWMQNRAFVNEVARQIREFEPDLIHVDGIGLIDAVARRHWGRVVLNHHNVESQLMRRRAEHQGRTPLGWYFRREAGLLERLEREVAPTVRLNLVVSDLDGQRLGEVAPGARFRTVENGVDTEYFRPLAAVPADPAALAFAGGMDWYPNRHAVDWLCGEIWPALTAGDPDWKVTVVGRAPTARLMELAERDPRVRAPGFVEDVRPWLSAARISVCPMTDGGGTRLKILDALAMERALVSTGLGVEGLALEDGRHYLNADTSAEFVRQCRRLRDDPDLAARLGREGRAHVLRHFSWEVVGGHLDEAYREALATGPDIGRGAAAAR